MSIKLPTFWNAQPHVWFQQSEAPFIIRSITADTTKYAYIVAALDQDTASHLLDLLYNPPTDNKYEAIKTRLLKTFALSVECGPVHNRFGDKARKCVQPCKYLCPRLCFQMPLLVDTGAEISVILATRQTSSPAIKEPS